MDLTTISLDTIEVAVTVANERSCYDLMDTLDEAAREVEPSSSGSTTSDAITKVCKVDGANHGWPDAVYRAITGHGDLNRRPRFI